MKNILLVAAILLLAFSAFADGLKLKDHELKFDKRMPSQVTGDFGKQFVTQIVDDNCNQSTAMRVFGKSKNEDELRKSFLAEARGIDQEFYEVMQYEFNGNNQCGEEAYSLARSLIKRSSCLVNFASKGYKLQELKKFDIYKSVSKKYNEIIANKEKIDNFNMPLSDDNSCSRQGKQTYLKLIDIKASQGIIWAKFFQHLN